MNGVVPSPAVAEKALRLVAQHRVWLAATEPHALVGGDSALWTVDAGHNGVWCCCPAGMNLDPVSCSHKVAAQIAWAEA